MTLTTTPTPSPEDEAVIARLEAARDNALAEARRLANEPEDEGEVGRTYSIERQLDDIENTLPSAGTAAQADRHVVRAPPPPGIAGTSLRAPSAAPHERDAIAQCEGCGVSFTVLVVCGNPRFRLGDRVRMRSSIALDAYDNAVGEGRPSNRERRKYRRAVAADYFIHLPCGDRVHVVDSRNGCPP